MVYYMTFWSIDLSEQNLKEDWIICSVNETSFSLTLPLSHHLPSVHSCINTNIRSTHYAGNQKIALMPLAHLRSGRQSRRHRRRGISGSVRIWDSKENPLPLFHSALNLYPFLKTCHPLLHSCTGASFNNHPLYLCLMFLPAASMLHM